jgi:uncharacterized repeat protein (TIGR01451 family)
MTARQLYAAGDVNGDNYDDFIVSGWKCGEAYTGKAYLFLGRPDVDSWGRFFPVEDADASFLGENTWDFLSYYSSTAGDVNGDGLDDFLVTSTHFDITGTEVITDAGKTYLFLGRAAADWGSDYPAAAADATFLGEATGDRLGRSTAGLGDVNGDGYDDFIIGSISSDYTAEDAGQNYLFLGRAAPGDPDYDPQRPWWGTDFSVAGADASFVGEAAGDESGRRVADAGDVNGDGLADLMIGAALNDQSAPDAGIAYLILGRAAADWGLRFPLADADASFIGEAAFDQAGRRLNGTGDVNGDGYADLLIGAPHNQRGSGEGDIVAGSAYLIYGRAAADWGSYFSLEYANRIFVGKPDVGVAGYDVAWLGDFDGDQIDDMLIAAYGGRNNNEVPGEVYIVSGTTTPEPFRYFPDADEGYVGEWRRFTAVFSDPNGPDDLAAVELLLTSGAGLTALDVGYDVAAGAFVLPGAPDTCAPGEDVRISSALVELACRESEVRVEETGAIRVMWRLRWLAPVERANVALHAYLRAVDLAGNDSGLRPYGMWELKWHDLVLSQTVAPAPWAAPGTPLTFTLTYGNAGANVATGVVITDVISHKLLNPAFASSRPITRTGDVAYTWEIGRLSPGEGGVITVTGTFTPDLPRGAGLVNTVTLTGRETDGDRENNRSALRVFVPFEIFLPVTTH